MRTIPMVKMTDMHRDPFEEMREENRKLRKRGDELFSLYSEAQFAVGLLTGHFPPFNDKTMELAKNFLAKRKAEWEAKQANSPPPAPRQ